MKHFDLPQHADARNDYALDLARRKRKQQRETVLAAILLALMVAITALYITQSTGDRAPAISPFSTSHVYIAH